MKHLRKKSNSECALNFYVTAELKESLQTAARAHGINVADLVRLSLRAMLPLLDALAETRKRLLIDLIARRAGQLRKRHESGDEDDGANYDV